MSIKPRCDELTQEVHVDGEEDLGRNTGNTSIYGRGNGEKPAKKSEKVPPRKVGGRPPASGRKAKRRGWPAVKCCPEVELDKERLLRTGILNKEASGNLQEISFHGRARR